MHKDLLHFETAYVVKLHRLAKLSPSQSVSFLILWSLLLKDVNTLIVPTWLNLKGHVWYCYMFLYDVLWLYDRDFFVSWINKRSECAKFEIYQVRCFFSNVYFSLVVLYILSTRTAFRFFKLFSRHLCFILNIVGQF